jgi:hypothetical protein
MAEATTMRKSAVLLMAAIKAVMARGQGGKRPFRRRNGASRALAHFPERAAGLWSTATELAKLLVAS